MTNSTLSPSTLVKFSCGCIGLRSEVPRTCEATGNQSGCYVIIRCEGSDRYEDDEGLHFAHRNLSNKDVTPLTGQEALDLLDTLGSLVFDGFRWRRFAADFRHTLQREEVGQ